MPIRVYYEVLNQKGTPALYSDNYAQRPAAGYQGRIFNSPDTGQIFYDTGTTWTLLADAGVGSGSLASVCANGNTTDTGIIITAGGLSTNSLTSTNLTAGSIPFVGTGGLISQDNANLFWDDTNNRLGLGTIIPTAPFDIHTTSNIGIQINNTSTADSKIAFLNADVGKWRIGNLYSGGANLFHIYNNAGSTLAMQINSSNAALFYGSLSANSFIQTNGGISLIHNSVPTSSGYTGIGGLTAGLSIALASGFNQTLTFPTGVGYTYTFPSATGTIALTSNLGGTTGYLPKYASGTSLGQSLFYDNGTAGYIGATSGGNGLFNAIATTGYAIDGAGYIKFRGDIGVGTPRQLEILCGGGNEVYFNTSGYGASYSTIQVFQTTNGASVNTNQLVLDQNGLVVVGSTASGSTKFQVSGTSYFSSSVGIGVNAPLTALHIVSGVRGVPANSGTSTSTTSFRLNGVSNGVLDMGEYSSASAGSYWMQVHDKTDQSANYNLLFQPNGGNVGIGTSNPTHNLEVANANGSSYIKINADFGIGYIGMETADDTMRFVTAQSTAMKFYVNNSLALSIAANGSMSQTISVGGGTFSFNNTSPSGYGISIIAGNGGQWNIYAADYQGTPNFYVTANGNGYLLGSAWSYGSDIRLKENIYDVENGLDMVLKIKPKHFDYINGTKNNLGFIAQDIQEIIPQAVSISSEKTEMLSLKTDFLLPYLVKAVQELNDKIENLN